MSLTSYRAAPPRVTIDVSDCLRNSCPVTKKAALLTKRAAFEPPFLAGDHKEKLDEHAFGRPGSDLLSRVLRRSTISAGAFHGRVRNGIGCSRSAITTRSAKSTYSRSCSICVHRRAMGMRNENDQADRAISTGKLQALPLFHTRPINVVVFHDSQGILVSRWVSRLDAFSGYPVRI